MQTEWSSYTAKSMYRSNFSENSFEISLFHGLFSEIRRFTVNYNRVKRYERRVHGFAYAGLFCSDKTVYRADKMLLFAAKTAYEMT